MVRSQIKNVLSVPLTKKSGAKAAAFSPVYRSPFKAGKKRLLGNSLPMIQLLLKEKITYQKLLEELTEIIRQHSTSADQLFFP
jgi:hypothetical protein